MSNTIKQLTDKINKLNNNNERALLLMSLEKKEFNSMFRLSAVSGNTLDILEYLYSNREELNLDVNAKGQSGKSAIHFAIASNMKNNLLFLLKLKEIAVDDDIRQVITDKFGEQFRTINIAPTYVPLGNELGLMVPVVSKATTLYSQNQTKLTEGGIAQHKKILSNLVSDFKSQNINQIKLGCLEFSKKFTSQMLQEISKLSAIYDKYEEMLTRYLPYNYAQEKLLYGDEFAKNNLNSSMKNTCLQNRSGFLKEQAAIDHNKSCIKSHIEQLFSQLILVEILFNPDFQAQVEQEPKLLPYVKKCQLPVKIAEPISVNKEPEILIEQIPEELISIKSTSSYAKKSKAETTPNEPTPIHLNPRIERLKGWVDELAQLKQKGQVKLSVYLRLLTDIGKDIDLEITQIKKGYLISQSSNRFSFHTPHKKDKGVDKAAIASMEHLLKDEIEAQHHCKK